MIVKILSSAATFSGVEYNENKVQAGSAKLMAVENFGLLEMDGGAANRSVHEYQQYFRAWSTSERGMIDKPQFHAVVSCEGREYSGEELKVLAEQYLDKMGYKNNPYLIYFHSDTANNHVHIVSSRINEKGLKINDSFEHRRSLAFIKEILGQDVKHDVNEQVKKALTYNFSTEAQFKLLLEGKGITVREKEVQYQFIKAGEIAHQIAKNLVIDKVNSYQSPEERTRQLKTLFAKYKPALSPEKFAEFMKSKFGVEVVMHAAKGKETPYGYTIIDHAKAQVLKGSQVMPITALLSMASREDTLNAGAELIAVLADNEALRFREFKSQLAKLGFELKPSGQVYISGEDKVSFTVSQERIKQLMYNDRLYEAWKYSANTPAESEVIGRVMGLKKPDYPPVQEPQTQEQIQNQIFISDKLNSLLATGKDLSDIAKERNYTFAKKADVVYLIDKKNHALYNMADLTDSKLDYSLVSVLDADRINRPEYARQVEYSAGNLGEVADQIVRMMQDIPQQEEQEPKRRRKRNQ